MFIQFKPAPMRSMQDEKQSYSDVEPIYEWLNQGRIDCVFVNGENNPSVPVSDVYVNDDDDEGENEDDEN